MGENETTTPDPRKRDRIEAELHSGQVLGKCRIEKEIGRGGNGAVYLAQHTTLDVPVAVKVLPPHIALLAPSVGPRFLREAHLAARLHHPNLVTVMDSDHDEETGLYYIVQEFVEGGTAKDLVEGGPLPEPRALAIISDIARALVTAADHNIVHRDIKPENILITTDGKAKLADLGLAKDLQQDAAGLTATSTSLGTPAYMSPEQVEDAKHADARSDLYSLGATLYFFLTGKPPFEGESVFTTMTKVMTEPVPNPLEARPNLSPRIAALCMKMMERDRDRRPQTAAEVLGRIDDLNKRAPTHRTRRHRRMEPKNESTPPRNVVLLLAIGALALAAVILFLTKDLFLPS